MILMESGNFGDHWIKCIKKQENDAKKQDMLTTVFLFCQNLQQNCLSFLITFVYTKWTCKLLNNHYHNY